MSEPKRNQNIVSAERQIKPIANEAQRLSGGLPCIEKPGHYSISDAGSHYFIVVYKPHKAFKLNKVLQRYPPDTSFTGHEPLFKVAKPFHALKAVRNALGIKGA